MKTKSIKSIVVVLVMCFSLGSYVYLNYNLVPNNDQISLSDGEVEIKKTNKSDEVLTELTFMKVVGKKLIDIITFSI